MAQELDRRIAITGLGVVGTFGLGMKAFWHTLATGKAEFAPCTRYRNPLPCAEAAQPDLRRLLRTGHLSRASLVSQFAVAAVHLALDQAGILVNREIAGHAIGIVYGTANGPGAATQEIYDDLLDHGPGGVKPRVFQESVFNAPASLASIHFGLKGPIQVLAGGFCSASSVLFQAQILLAHLNVKAVIALCADELCEAIQSALRVLRWHQPTHEAGDTPPAGSRLGAISSEGAAALILERGADALARGAVTLAEMAGAASTNDAWKLAQAAGDGRGLTAAMKGCLADAEAVPADVDLILSASAGTTVEDRLEETAIRSIFGDTPPPIASTKNDIGYAMGAAAMFDIALAAEMINHDRVPDPWNRAQIHSSGIGAVLCTGIGLNGLFGAALIRRATW